MSETEPVQTTESSFSKTPIFIVLILLLLLSNLFFFYKNYKLKQDKQLAIELLEEQKVDLQNEYEEVLAELDSYKELNVELDSTLTDMQQEIEAQKVEIEKLLRKSRYDRSELKNAQAMVDALKFNVTDFTQQINNLKYQNEQLSSQNKGLNEQNQNLSQRIVKKDSTITFLEVVKTELETETSSLKETKEMLTKKVDRASVMQAVNLAANAVRYKRSGVEVETNNNKKAEKIRVCFDILANPVAPKGGKELLLRILSPEGTVLSVESLGSGMFNSTETGEAMQYTNKATLQYNSTADSYCMYWKQNSEFMEGVYNAQLYHEGYLISDTNFELK